MAPIALGLLCGQVAVPGWIQGTNPPPTSSWPLRSERGMQTRPGSHCPPPGPAVVACHTSHAITTMIKATATSHRGHCGDHQFLMGLRLGLHLCHSTENFPELLCSHAISSKLPSGACEDHEPAATSSSTLAKQAPGLGASADEPEAWNVARLPHLPTPAICLDNVYLAFKLK